MKICKGIRLINHMNIAEFIAVIKVARGNKTFIQKKKIIYKNKKIIYF